MLTFRLGDLLYDLPAAFQVVFFTALFAPDTSNTN